MSLTAPNSEIYLLKTPIELDNNNQITFATATAQHDYFASCPKLNISEATFQRKDGFIRYPANMETVLGYNYCMYRNKNHGNKWFYAFITGVEYLSENSCAINIKTDVWQTWMFQLNWHPCFVEREHVNDDTFGKHTIPEGLEYGDYIVSSHSKIDFGNDLDECTIIAQVSTLLEGTGKQHVQNESRVYSGVPQGCWLIGIPIRSGSSWYFNNLSEFLLAYDDFGKANAIISLFIVPKKLLTVSSAALSWVTPRSPSDHVYTFGFQVIPSSYTATLMDTTTTSKPTTLNGYSPKNNKCFCSPYSFLNVTNNAGAVVSYAWELFDSTPEFVSSGTIGQGCDIKITPTNYRNANAAGNYDYSVTCAKYPLLSWNSDYYLNWQAVNGPITEVKAGLTALSFGTSVIGGMIGGDFSGANITGLAGDVANIMQQLREAEMAPDSAKGNLGGLDLTYALDRIGFSLQKMTIRYEYAKMIDDYFSAFGYKVNELKTPNITGRTNWNYVKTVGCNVTANAPQEDVEEIRGMFDRGITLWHTTDYYLDYSRSNTIVS